MTSRKYIVSTKRGHFNSLPVNAKDAALKIGFGPFQAQRPDQEIIQQEKKPVHQNKN